MDKFRIKTTQGYFFTEGRGYGRFYGTKLQVAVLCEKHANQIIKVLKEHLHEYEPEKESFPGHAQCRSCS